MSSAAPEPDPQVADAIARAEWRREMLEELAVVGMALSKDIAQRSMESPYHPELKHDPGRSFAFASRAVRLTLALAAKTDEQILALRKGGIPAVKASRTRPGEEVSRRADAQKPNNPEIGHPDEAAERLIEHERDAALPADFHASIDAIRGALGLGPDRSRGYDDEGVARAKVDPVRARPAAKVERFGSDLEDDAQMETVEVLPHRRQ